MSISCMCRPERGTLTRRLATASIIISVAGSLAGSARAETRPVSPIPQGLRAVTRIGDRTSGRQRGPDVVVSGRLIAPHPSGSGVVTLLLDGATGHRRVGLAYPGGNGVFSFLVPLADALAGAKRFTLSFRPYNSSRYAAATRSIDVDMLTPDEYPFARPPEDRSPTPDDRLPSLWDDGGTCSVGCRPVGAIDGWPLKPFHGQHALRAGFDEHRPSGFHVGIDIQAKDWSPVYAIQPGRAHILDSRWPDARVQVGNYIYWHVHPAVREGQRVIPYVTVLGHVLRSMGHLHLSEVTASGRYLNPLRPGGRVLFPYADDEPPVIGRPLIAQDGGVTIDVFDPQSFRVRTRYLTPVLAPAGLAYRLWHRDGTPDGPLRWALRATQLLDPSLVPLVFTASAHEPGYRCFATRTVCRPTWQYRLAGGLAPPLDLARDRGERLTVYAWDWAGNRTARDVWL
jgi:hypothetical protein